jgi:hypothetical protein
LTQLWRHPPVRMRVNVTFQPIRKGLTKILGARAKLCLPVFFHPESGTGKLRLARATR